MLRVSKSLRGFFNKQAELGLLSNTLSPATELAASLQNLMPEFAQDTFRQRLDDIEGRYRANTPLRNILTSTVLGGLGGTVAASGYHGYKHLVDPGVNIIPFGYGPLIGAGLGAGLGTLEELLIEGPRRRNRKDLLELLVPISDSLFSRADPSSRGGDALRKYTPNGE